MHDEKSFQGEILDPDGDRLSNGLEAWFGTRPGEFNAGVSNLSTNGTTTVTATASEPLEGLFLRAGVVQD